MAVKLAELAPAVTANDAGTPKTVPLLLERLIAVPPDGADCERLTVQLAVPPEASVVGVHWTVETVGNEVTVIEPPVPATLTLLPSGDAPMMPFS